MEVQLFGKLDTQQPKNATTKCFDTHKIEHGKGNKNSKRYRNIHVRYSTNGQEDKFMDPQQNCS